MGYRFVVRILLLVLSCSEALLDTVQPWTIDEGFCNFANQYRCRARLASIETVKAHIQQALITVNVTDWKKYGVSSQHLQDIMSFLGTIQCTDNASNCPDFHPWNGCTEGPIAAPNSHTVLMNNSEVQVLSVSVPTNTREPFHTHEAFSIMMTNMGGDSGDGQRYFNEHNEIVFDEKPHKPNATAEVHVQWMLPEWFHSIQNTGPMKQGQEGKLRLGKHVSGYHALRVMLLGSYPPKVMEL